MAPNAASTMASTDTHDVSLVCEQLDNLLIKIMDDYDQLQALYKSIATHMGSGHMNIAQARHFKGPTTVGELQYPANMSPLLKVQIASSAVDPSLPTFELNEYVSFSPFDPYADNMTATDSAKSSELRQRGGAAGGKESTETATDEPKPAKPRDPLRWFGVLVPAPLRQAQKDFKAATTAAVEAVTIKSRLLQNIGVYEELKKQKKVTSSVNTAGSSDL